MYREIDVWGMANIGVRKDTLDETLPKIAPILRFVIARIKKVVSLHH